MSDAERERNLALIAAVSGDPALAQAAQVMQRMGPRRQSAIQLGNGFIYDPETGQTWQDPKFAAFVASRDRAAAERADASEAARDARLNRQLDAQDARSARTLVARGENVPFNQRVHAAEANRLAQEARELYGELRRVSGVVSSPKDILASATGAVPAVGTGVARVAEGQMFTPEQRAVKARGRRFEQNLSNLAAGMALTGFELEQREKWSPFASGISQEEALARLLNVERDFGARRDSILTAGGLAPGGENANTPPARATKRVRVDEQGNAL
jgi:hypothetical protein